LKPLAIDAVPEVADVFGIPDEQTLKCRDQEFSVGKAPNKFHDVLVPDAYPAITVAQLSASVKNPGLYEASPIGASAAALAKHPVGYGKAPITISRFVDVGVDVLVG
jgi:hypothetical protein